MVVGGLIWSGQATVAEGTPGVKGEIAVGIATLSDDDSVIVTMSHTAEQDTSDIKYQNLTFQVVKVGGTGFTIYCNQPQNPEVIVDYMVMEVSST